MLALLLLVLLPSRAGAEVPAAARVLAMINRARTDTGLAPLASNPQLTAAAQAHADDLAHTGYFLGHNGSDGSTPIKRILASGYRPYSWGPMAGENWAAYQTIETSMGFWLGDPPHRDNILQPRYREIGVGLTVNSSGIPIIVTDFGAQPNVLPVFVVGSGPTVTVILSNEDTAAGGDGPNVIGRAVRVEMSTDSGFTLSRSSSYARSIQFSSFDGTSISTVYVRFHDSLGRTTLSSSTPSTSAVAAPDAAPPAPTTAPTSTLTRAPTRTPTRTSTPRPSSTATSPPTETSTSTPLPTGTDTILPSLTPAQTAVSLILDATSLPEAVEKSPSTGDLFPPIAQVLYGAAGLVFALALLVAIRRR